MSSTLITMSPKIYDYYLDHTVRSNSILESLLAETLEMPMGDMQISPEQGVFMHWLVKAIGARKAIELGTFTGYSAMCIAQALPEDGKLITCDINSEWTAIAKRYWEAAEVYNKIELRLAPALESLQALLDEGQAGTFDFAFIDADKANYLSYYEMVLALVRGGGVIAIDNVLWHGAVANKLDTSRSTQVIRQLNHNLKEDERIDLSMLPIGDGLTLAMKRK
ncbi:MAG: SAM-dependent methyltransferase [Legionellales bacterium]|nr:SAM-dependent methyltransferase [Legionellales bacterium]